MNAADDDGNHEFVIDECDILDEVSIDDEDLPDAYDDQYSDSEHSVDVEDSVHTFIRHNEELYSAACRPSDSTEHKIRELYSAACSPSDATLVATGGQDDRGFLWNIGDEVWYSELKGHKDSVSSLAFSHDGQFLASGCLGGIVQVWDVLGNLKGTLEGPRGGIEWLRWHPRGHILLAGSEDSTVWMWNAERAAFANMFVGHGASVTCGDFTPDGKIICTGSEDATLRIWNPKSGESIHVVRGHPYHAEGLTCLSISSSSTLALTGSGANPDSSSKYGSGSAHIVNISTGKVINTPISHSGSIECVGFSPSDSWAAIGGLDKKLVIWDVEHSLSRSTCNHEGGVTCLAWLDASNLATGCSDGNVRLWDSRSGECTTTFRGHSNAIYALCVSADNKYLVSASYDGTARVFELGSL
ncbi:hypothetical protein HN51_029887 [Arachis hypogaea]|uniref:Uncharacterized protein n=1 Tax=Arachis hypogaea TaxID=3818 RepID=A0A445BD62_ARAHY|nr:angio-associated migratory cell protein isoform X1 [Arachis hypogaea]QHO36606.1 Angio-associated migratory cell protein [Arachis hypogaea]RYR36613.1 hypothetical protein Ahy_A09g041577 [Arachis hypogaea]